MNNKKLKIKKIFSFLLAVFAVLVLIINLIIETFAISCPSGQVSYDDGTGENGTGEICVSADSNYSGGTGLEQSWGDAQNANNFKSNQNNQEAPVAKKSYAQQDVACVNYDYPWCKDKPGDIAGLIKRFYDYALAAVGVAALGAIIFGGIKYTVSAGNPSSQADAISWITGAVWGLVLLLGANLLLRTINPKLTELKMTKLTPAEVEKVGIQPNSTVPFSELPKLYELTKTEQAQKNKEVARNITDSGKVKFSINDDCSGFDAKRSMSQLSRDGVATACSDTCNCNTPVVVDTNLLIAVQKLSQKYPIQINSITTGEHSPTSKHYQGKAIDIDVTDIKQRDNVVKELTDAGFKAFCDKKGIEVSCDRADHIHYQIK